jgi:hypothetical protein
MTLIEILAAVFFVLFLLGIWWFDLFCFKRTYERWVSKEACKQFCTKRPEGCHLTPDDAEEKCPQKQLHEEAKSKLQTLRSVIKSRFQKNRK